MSHTCKITAGNTFNAVICGIKKSVINIGFLSAVFLTALLCFTDTVFTDHATGKAYSVFEAVFMTEYAVQNGKIAFSSVRIFRMALSGYVPMFMPILAAFPFVFSDSAERNSGCCRSCVSRVGAFRYYTSRFISAVISGGLAIGFGTALYGIIVEVIFPDISAFASPAEISDMFPDRNAAVITEKLLSAMLCGAFSVVPAFYIGVFSRDPYLVLGIPFLLTFVWNTFINSLSENDFELYLKIQPTAPLMLPSILSQSTESMVTTLVFNGIITVIVFIVGYIITNSFLDRGSV